MKKLVVIACLSLTCCGKAPLCDVSKLTTPMTSADVEKICGKPSKINGSSYREQWVYDHESYIYIENGHFIDAQWTKYP